MADVTKTRRKGALQLYQAIAAVRDTVKREWSIKANMGFSYSVMAVMWGHADAKSGECNPSLETISNKSMLAKSTVTRIVTELCRIGVLKNLRKGGKNQGSTLYQVAPEYRVLNQSHRAVENDVNQSHRLPDTPSTAPTDILKNVNKSHRATNIVPTNCTDIDKSISPPRNEKSNGDEPENKPTSQKKSVRYKFDEVDEKVCESLRTINQTYRPDWEFGNYEKSCQAIRLLRTKGGGCEKHGKIGPVSVDRIRKAVRWLRDDNTFWFETGNMRSGAALREAFPLIESQMQSNGTGVKPTRDEEARVNSDAAWDEMESRAK